MAAIVIGTKQYLSVADAAALLEVEPAHVRHLARQGRLAKAPDQRPVYVTVESVERYKRERRPWAPVGVEGGKRAAVRLGLGERLRDVEGPGYAA